MQQSVQPEPNDVVDDVSLEELPGDAEGQTILVEPKARRGQQAELEQAPEPEPAEEVSEPQDLTGTSIGGRYQVIKRIGRGGMGVVYLAQQSALSREVVIKVLAPNLVGDRNAMARFEREARGLSRLQHPNVVTIFDFGREGRIAYIAMEYVQGETLSRFLKRNGAIPFREFAPVAVQILKGIGEAHKLGLIHRDIKPANIMLCELEGEPNFVKILDFGLAKLVESPVEVTKEQHLVGSAAFLAPEQILNGVSDPRSDVYALGVMFYMMLSGKRPFEAKNDAVLLYKHVNEEPTSLSSVLPAGHEVPTAVSALIARCLSKTPEDRPQDANALLAEFSSSVSGGLLRTPWNSGEMAALPSAIVDLASRVTDAEDVTPSPAPQSAPVVLPEQKSSHKLLWFFLLVLVLAGAGTAVVLLLNNATPTMSPKVTESAPQADASEQLAGVLDKAADEIAGSRWGKAESLLDSISEELKAYPELLDRAADYREQIAMGRLYADAERLAGLGDVEAAIGKFEEIVQRDGSQQLAKDRLAALMAQREPAPKTPGTLSVSATQPAVVFINGAEAGPTPLSRTLPPGKHQIKVLADGFVPFESEVELASAESLRVEVPLVEEKRRGSHSSKSDGGKSKDSGKDDSSKDSGKSDTGKSGDSGKSKTDLLLPIGTKKDDSKKPKNDLLLPIK